ncbi:MAG: Uma2 family endonuclease [Deltaproteobacteria bacterium]|nr:Uma2 family endonuclease [Deltaproteobacteria bacterium]
MVSLKHTEHTIEDLMDLPEDTKAELIDGEIYMMAPAAAKHSIVNGALTSVIYNHFREKRKNGSGDGHDFWLIVPEAWNYYDEHNSFVHGIAGYLESEISEPPQSGPIMTKPMWLCEILSPSNWSNDTQRKRVILEEHRVPHYWLVDPERKTIQVLEMPDGATKYQFAHAVDVKDGTVKLPPFMDLELDLTEIFRH